MPERKTYRTAIYLRLSKGDGDVDGVEKSESNSISNQRLITERYLEQHPELQLVDTYIDDGYTGTNFKRPELKRMLFDIDEGRIDCVVVKDLSRFGRERIATGNYINHVFREKGVRFIAVNDHYDSLTADGNENHLIMPIKALTNDNFSRDISMKVRSSFEIKRAKGDWIAPFAPYGYKKDPENVNHLLIDEPAAEVVRRIFSMRIEGMSSNAIADELNRTGVQTPGDYKRSCGVKYSRGKKRKASKWCAAQVIRILKNETLTGNTVQGKTTKVSYKVNKQIKKPREEWDIVRGTHEAIISESDFRIVQSILQRDMIKVGGDEPENVFAGLIFCGDCGRCMVRRKRQLKKRVYRYYCCAGYNCEGSCTGHKIMDNELEELVLISLNDMIRKLCKADELARNLESISISRESAIGNDAEIQRLKEELEKCGRMKAALYQDAKEGIISNTQYERYRSQYTDREIELQAAITAQKEMIDRIYEHGIAGEELLRQFREKPRIDELNHRLLVSLIDRILIYEDHRIEIVYRYTAEMEKCEQIVQAVS